MIEESAGGIVFRHTQAGWEILLIEDRYGYWTFPKGKKELGETDEQTALREIAEETQVVGEIVSKLDTSTYSYQHTVHGSVDKIVTYYFVRAITDDIQPQEEEIDDVRWFLLKDADQLIKENGYANNRHVFELAKQKLMAEEGVR